MNVWEFVGDTFSQFTEPAGFPTGYTYLCAELNPHLHVSGKTWSHLLKFKEGNGNEFAVFARFAGQNVLWEVMYMPRFLPHFPYGYSVLPD